MLSKRGPPKDYDIPSTIVIYIVVLLLGVGMCFCLKRANRLLPNQRSFQLRPTEPRRRRGYDVGDEEQGDPESRIGLLSGGQYDIEDEEEEEHGRFADRRNWRQDRRSVDDEDGDSIGRDEDEEFGDMQGATMDTTHGSSFAPPAATNENSNEPRTPLFNIADDEEDSDNEETKVPTAITLDISDVEELDSLRELHQQEEARRVEMAKKVAQQGGDKEKDNLFNQTLSETKTKKKDTAIDTVASAEASSSSRFVAKRRRLANSSTSQQRSADARKRLGIDDDSKPQQPGSRQL
ncbi:hypothetical protein BDB00DRAFT_875308 [Zychaea mexicana]|uniref:uncharacterized protein n=1 Tax=Zychaea mexicana TaxID=64656 RepID=UPI0022FE1ACD|nr:uncharacterized protein BDB00DRAFT_875308 [Zychaea mexicana]KAI9490407.1 hypothetical protein BDB00DRAFT_875308 [Zychaea mexicana]